MDAAMAEGLAIMTTFVATGTFVLIGFRMRLGHKERMAELEHGAPDAHSEAVVETLQRQVEALGQEVADLSERMDFTERLLTQGRQSDARQGGVETPV